MYPEKTNLIPANQPETKAKDDQPARAENIAAIVSYFESGIKDTCCELGIELEHTIVTDDLQPVSYNGEHGVQWILSELAAAYPEETRDAEGDLLGVSRPRESVTLEPAAQLELSAGPFSSLADAEETFKGFEQALATILGPVGEKALTIGYHPTAKARELKLIPKRRYQLMNMYLGEVDTYGVNMMRGSASTQVSIDYHSAEDCLRKLRLSSALVPVFSLICDNAPVFEGTPRPHPLVRTDIWNHTDKARCGIVPDLMDPDFTFADYAAYILDTPAIVVPCSREQWCYATRTFGEVYSHSPMTRDDVIHAVSMFFTDVRLKTYVEIRPADAMPIPYVIAYAALIKGLFYPEKSLDALDEMLGGVRNDDIADAKTALMEAGYNAQVYGRPVAEIADALMQLAHEGLEEDERHYLEPLASLVAKRTTLADAGLGQ